MILLTVGTQLSFDRLISLVDKWAHHNPRVEILAQIADGKYIPKYMPYVDYLKGNAYATAFNNASVVIAHAGMGTVISSLISSKPVIVFPRKASLGEHRNEHQLATCSKIVSQRGCYVAYEPDELFQTLDELSTLEGGSINPFANADLLKTIDQFISSQV
ncbi:MAG: UDP-N-acetylglucosamine transferase subunit ALG13 [Polaribacter sp.]|jgi:UDP-N-acetylglucosamine transferase subunit ALG13